MSASGSRKIRFATFDSTQRGFRADLVAEETRKAVALIDNQTLISQSFSK
jgi:hypothetical protein